MKDSTVDADPTMKVIDQAVVNDKTYEVILSHVFSNLFSHNNTCFQRRSLKINVEMFTTLVVLGRLV